MLQAFMSRRRQGGQRSRGNADRRARPRVITIKHNFGREALRQIAGRSENAVDSQEPIGDYDVIASHERVRSRTSGSTAPAVGAEAEARPGEETTREGGWCRESSPNSEVSTAPQGS